MYDSIVARFLQEDTYTGDKNDPLSLNLYTYCANNPLIYDDPTGHVFKEVYNWGKDKVQSGWNSLKSGAKKAWNDVKEFWDDPASKFDEWNKSDKFVDGVASFLGVPGGNKLINKYVTTRVEGLVSNAVDFIKGMDDTLNLVGDTIKYTADTIASGIGNLIGVDYTSTLQYSTDIQSNGLMRLDSGDLSSKGKEIGERWKAIPKGIVSSFKTTFNLDNAINYFTNPNLTVREAADYSGAVINTVSTIYGGVKVAKGMGRGISNTVKGAKIARNIAIDERLNGVSNKGGIKANLPSEAELNNAVSEWVRMQKSLAPSKSKITDFNTGSVVYDVRTGEYYYGMNKWIKLNGDRINETLSNILPKESLNRYQIGNCAEVDAVNQALNNNANLSDLYIYTIDATTDKLRIPTNTFGTPKLACENYTYTFQGKVKDIVSGHK